MPYKSKALKNAAMKRKTAYAYGKSLMALRRQGRLKVSAGGYKPIFTETVAGPALNVAIVGLGGRFSPNMGQIPQLAQYANLYRKYRILKCTVFIVPYFNSYDANAQAYNYASTVNSFGQPRIVYSIDDTPTGAPPGSELEVLNNNGCKIKTMSNTTKITFKPVPNIKDTNGEVPILKNNFLVLNPPTTPPTANNADHFGVNFWMSCYAPGTGAGSYVSFQTYYKLTFQLSDPK